jgi:hypothetical protein
LFICFRRGGFTHELAGSTLKIPFVSSQDGMLHVPSETDGGSTFEDIFDAQGNFIRSVQIS